MKFTPCSDLRKIDKIAKASEAASTKNAIQYLRVNYISGAKGYICETVDDIAFYAGVMGKKHFRLYEIAVEKAYQHQGYGTAMMDRIKALCITRGVSKITLRTSKQETAIDFYRKYKAAIVGEKNNDWEVEITL